MTWWHSHPNAAEIVRKNWRGAELFILASSEPCLAIRADELANIDRVMIAGSLDELRSWRPRKSWFLAVLLCPDDSTEELAQIVQKKRLSTQRIHFYLAKGTPRSALSGWAKADLPLDAIDEGIEDWESLHRLLGIDFNVQIVDDELEHAKR